MIQIATFPIEQYEKANKFMKEQPPRGENGLKIFQNIIVVSYEDGEQMGFAEKMQKALFERASLRETQFMNEIDLKKWEGLVKYHEAQESDLDVELKRLADTYPKQIDSYTEEITGIIDQMKSAKKGEVKMTDDEVKSARAKAQELQEIREKIKKEFKSKENLVRGAIANAKTARQSAEDSFHMKRGEIKITSMRIQILDDIVAEILAPKNTEKGVSESKENASKKNKKSL